MDYSKKRPRVVIGSDRGLFTEDGRESSPHPKIFSRKMKDGDEFIMGACGDCFFGDRLEQIDFKTLTYTVIKKGEEQTLELTVNEKDRKNPGKFLKTKFVPALMENLNIPKKQEFDIIIGIFDSIFVINEDWAVIAIGEHGTAIGSGGPPAKAAIHALHEMSTTYKHLDPTIIISTALDAAEKNSNFCLGPFDLLELS